MSSGLIWMVVLGACATPPTRPVENRAPTRADVPAPGACPHLLRIDSSPWQSIAFPQCPGEPFETDLTICAGRACPRPCRVIMSYPDLPSTTLEVRYDEAGRWLASIPTAARSDSIELRREATYKEDRMQSCRSGNAHVDSTSELIYDRDRLVRISNGRDGEIQLAYDANRLVRIADMRIAYDASGRIVAVTDEDNTTAYRYDDTGLLVDLVHESGQPLEHSRFTYDARRRLVRVDSTLHGGDASASTVTINYDGSGRITQIVNDETVDRVYRYAMTYEYCE